MSEQNQQQPGQPGPRPTPGGYGAGPYRQQPPPTGGQYPPPPTGGQYPPPPNSGQYPPATGSQPGASNSPSQYPVPGQPYGAGAYPPPGQPYGSYPAPGQPYGSYPAPGQPYGSYPAPGQPYGSDPYRYGAPPQLPNGRTTPTGKQILTSTWQLLKQDRELIALPVLGAIFGFIAFLIFFVPGLVLGFSTSGNSSAVIYVFSILGGFAASVIGIYFQSALVVGAYQRADGNNPTLGGVLAVAWRLRRQILGWAVFTTIIGTIIRIVEQRLGVVGKIVGFLGGIAWAVATFFAVPIIVAEGLGPIDALKKSAATIREIWGTSVRTTLRFGLIQFVLAIVPVVLIIAGVGVASSGGSGSAAGGIVLAAIGALLLIAMGVVFGAISTYARALIYRWTTGRPVPGIDPELFAGAFAARRGRGRGF